jgi:hypothetical protein
VRPQSRVIGLPRLDRYARLSPWLPDIDVAAARDDSWSGHHLSLLRLAIKLSHVGAEVDGLAYRPHRPTDCG